MSVEEARRKVEDAAEGADLTPELDLLILEARAEMPCSNREIIWLHGVEVTYGNSCAERKNWDKTTTHRLVPLPLDEYCLSCKAKAELAKVPA